MLCWRRRENVSVNTKDLRYNISDLLQDTAYNRYFVKVKARDGGHESEFAESQIFSFNYLRPTNITCKFKGWVFFLTPILRSFFSTLQAWKVKPASFFCSQVTSSSPQSSCLLETESCLSNSSTLCTCTETHLLYGNSRTATHWRTRSAAIRQGPRTSIHPHALSAIHLSV